MRNFIDIVEASVRFSLPADLYHASKTHLVLGTILEPRGNFSVEPEIEIVLEESRPDDQPPRAQVVYMMADPFLSRNFGIGGANEIYRVVPIGKVWRHDASIIGVMQKSLRSSRDVERKTSILPDVEWDDITEIKKLAEMYWQGAGNPYRKRSLWLFEYTSRAATVCEQLSGTKP